MPQLKNICNGYPDTTDSFDRARLEIWEHKISIFGSKYFQVLDGACSNLQNKTKERNVLQRPSIEGLLFIDKGYLTPNGYSKSRNVN